MNTIARYVDNHRVHLHLRLAELELRHRNTSNLPQTQQQARINQLDRLRDYWQQGIFPHNVDHKQRAPIFIDHDGRVCAVAHLVIQSGHTDVAQRIHLATNDAYVRDMPFPELVVWAQANGLTREELARIQPTYEPTVSDPVAFAALISTANNLIAIAGLGVLVGVWLFIMHVRSVHKKINTLRWSALLTIVGIVISLFAFFSLFGAVNNAYAMLNFRGMSYGGGGYGLQFSNVVGQSTLILLAGILLAVSGFIAFMLRYTARLRKRRSEPLASG